MSIQVIQLEIPGLSLLIGFISPVQLQEMQNIQPDSDAPQLSFQLRAKLSSLNSPKSAVTC